MAWRVKVMAPTVLVAVAAVTSGCADEIGAAATDAASQAAQAGTDAALSALRTSPLVKESQAYVDEKLAAGVSRDDLVAAVEKARQAGKTSPAAACVRIELIRTLSLTSAVSSCRFELVNEVGNSIN